MRAVKIRIRGKVQGVAYRAYAARKAKSLQLSGWIRNEDDGSVYAEAEGPDEAIEAFIAWTRQGSPLARVEEVQVEPLPPQGFRDFRIVR